jgi:RND family efflux transporter MFP subunit
MSDWKRGQVLKQAATVLAGAGSLSDSELLRRYTLLRDEAAFEALVRRHGRLVFGLSRRVLGARQDAEDAFQATFLVLARKAKSISRSEMVGTWLYKVAYRVALAARARRAKNAVREKQLDCAAVSPSADASAAAQWAEAAAILDDEVQRLPARLRSAIVLCYFGGKTVDEAADTTGCPRGTMASRLARARERLRLGLTKRGVVLSAAALAAGLSEAGAGAGPPLQVVWGAVAVGAAKMAATEWYGLPVSAQVVSLTLEVIRAMSIKKTLTIAVTLAVVLLALFGGGLVGMQLSQRGDEGAPEAAVAATDQPPGVKTGPNVELCKPVEREVTPSAVYSGNLEARPVTEVISPAVGNVAEVRCQLGATVKAGDVLVCLSTPGLTETLRKAEASYAKAAGEFKRWDTELGRAKDLAKKGVYDKQTLDEVMIQHENATQILKNAEGDVQSAKKQIEGATILAPVNGTIGEISRAKGSFVQVNSPLVKIIEVDPMGLVFEMDEATYVRYMRQVRDKALAVEGASITVSLLVDNSVKNVGKITNFDNHFDAKTGTIKVRGSVPNPKKDLLAGMSITVCVDLGKPHKAVLLPQSAVFMRDGQSYVTVFSEKLGAQERRVTVGAVDDGLYVIEDGLKADEWVVKKAR